MDDIVGIASVAHLLAPDFVESDGAVLLASDTDCARRNRKSFQSLTELEAACNHVHILDHFENLAERDEPLVLEDGFELFYDFDHPHFAAACMIGVSLVHAWGAALRVAFPLYHFRVYYTERDNPIVRFHRVRDDETPWYGDDEIRERGPDGRVLALDTRTGEVVESTSRSDPGRAL